MRMREEEKESESERERRRSTSPNKEKTETCTNDESLISGQGRTFSFHYSLFLSFSFPPILAQTLFFNICLLYLFSLFLLIFAFFQSATFLLAFFLSLCFFPSHFVSNVNFSIRSLFLSTCFPLPPLHIYHFTFNHMSFFVSVLTFWSASELRFMLMLPSLQVLRGHKRIQMLLMPFLLCLCCLMYFLFQQSAVNLGGLLCANCLHLFQQAY